ncbi:MAG: DNA alkylation repair protein [Dehalococcoidia bacterium]
MTQDFTAERFIERMEALRSDDELRKIQRYFKSGEGQYGEGDVFMGVKMGQVFALAKEFVDMAADDIEKLLESPLHEVRAGALSLMSKQASLKRTPENRRKDLFDLYMSRHDRINNWDLVDVAAPMVVGQYLFDKPRGVLYELARSSNLWERRTAIVSTAYFIKRGELDDTFKLAELLLHDEEDMIQKPVGGWLRFAGDQDRPRLRAFLDQHADTMPRTALRYALEHFDKEERERYMNMRKATR